MSRIYVDSHITLGSPAHFAPRLHLISPLLAHLICMACPTGCQVQLPHGLGASLLGQIVGVGLLALLDWAAGVGLLALPDWVVGMGLLALLDWAVGMGLLPLLDWAMGVQLLALVFHVYISIHSCLVPGPQTTLGHLGPKLGGTLHHQSTSGVWGCLIEC